MILTDRGDEERIIKIERQQWLHDVLIALGIKEENLSDSLETKEHLAVLELEVWAHNDEIEIKKAGKIIAQWKQPKIIVRNVDKKLYSEIYLNEWAQPFQLRKGGR